MNINFPLHELFKEWVDPARLVATFLDGKALCSVEGVNRIFKFCAIEAWHDLAKFHGITKDANAGGSGIENSSDLMEENTTSRDENSIVVERGTEVDHGAAKLSVLSKTCYEYIRTERMPRYAKEVHCLEHMPLFSAFDPSRDSVDFYILFRSRANTHCACTFLAGTHIHPDGLINIIDEDHVASFRLDAIDLSQWTPMKKFIDQPWSPWSDALEKSFEEAFLDDTEVVIVSLHRPSLSLSVLFAQDPDENFEWSGHFDEQPSKPSATLTAHMTFDVASNGDGSLQLSWDPFNSGDNVWIRSLDLNFDNGEMSIKLCDHDLENENAMDIDVDADGLIDGN